MDISNMTHEISNFFISTSWVLHVFKTIQQVQFFDAENARYEPVFLKSSI